MTQKAFDVHRKGGRWFLAIPRGTESVLIVDEFGGNHGCWYSWESFRATTIDTRVPLSTVRIGIVAVLEEK